MPPPNPTVMLEMSLEQFNQLQRVMSRGRFNKVADLIFMFRAQVNAQVERLNQQAAPQRPHLVEPEAVTETTA